MYAANCNENLKGSSHGPCTHEDRVLCSGLEDIKHFLYVTKLHVWHLRFTFFLKPKILKHRVFNLVKERQPNPMETYKH